MVDDAKVTARARNNAYALLKVRPRSEKELFLRLAMKGYGEGLAKEIVGELRSKGLVDDVKFARFWVDSRLHLNPVGDVILRRELAEKGVSGDIIEATLVTKVDGYDEYEVAKNMAVERFRRFQKIDRRRATKRVYDFLLRRGFKYDTVRRIIEEITG